METTTRQGTSLTVHLTVRPRLPAGHPEPIVEFRYRGGILCCSYYLSTLQDIPAGEGLCLRGGSDPEELAPDAVAACRAQCAAWMREVQGG